MLMGMETHTYTMLVAFTVVAPDPEEAQRTLMSVLPTPTGPVEEWWLAEDVRQDGSDCESAIFIPKELSQDEAYGILIGHLAERLFR